MAVTKTHDLKVKVAEYTDKTGAKKGRWITVGRVMASDDGSEFWLLDKTFNPAGVPDLNGKGSEAVMVCKFALKDYSQAGPSEHQQAKANGYVSEPAGGLLAANFADDLPF